MSVPLELPLDSRQPAMALPYVPQWRLLASRLSLSGSSPGAPAADVRKSLQHGESSTFSSSFLDGVVALGTAGGPLLQKTRAERPAGFCLGVHQATETALGPHAEALLIGLQCLLTSSATAGIQVPVFQSLPAPVEEQHQLQLRGASLRAMLVGCYLAHAVIDCL